MRIAIAISILLLKCLPAYEQYYLRGEVKDENNAPLSNARIILHSNGYLYYSGGSGGFGIMSTQPVDSITVSLDGYRPIKARLESEKYQILVLRPLGIGSAVPRNRLLSVTKNLKPQDRYRPNTAGETYSTLLENDYIPTRKYPESGFAITTDKASYSNIRRFINMNTTIPPDAVRVEELINYFNFDYAPPPRDSVFSFGSYVSDCPWNEDAQLLFLHICAKKIDPAKIPPSNLVFLIDVSGSMDMPNRLPLLKSAFKLLVDNLREQDTVSIVVYGSSVGVWLPPVSGKEKEKIRKSIESLNPGGSTPGESGIRTAYRLARRQFIPGGNNRVILATDGDFNVGQTSDEELERLIILHQQSGIYLTCLGVGMGNYKDSKLEVLARKGNGNFAYLDDEREAEKVLVKEFTQTLYTVADDAYLNIHFNPSQVTDYRLVGYDNKLKALADSTSVVEGGEVGSGHSLIAMFEIKSHEGITANTFSSREGLARVSVRYRLPGDSLYRVSAYRCPAEYTAFEDLPASYRFASSVSMFALMLKNSKHARRVTWSDVIQMADQSYNRNDAVQGEFINMVENARKIYRHHRKRRNR